MKVKMVSTAAGPDGVFLAGRDYEVSAKQGKELCSGGYATPIAQKQAAKAETRKEDSEDETE